MSLVRRNADWFSPVAFDSFFDRFLNEGSGTANSFVPQVDIAETEKAFEIQLAVPGMKKKDFKIDLKDGLLSISGERKLNKEQKDKNFYSVQTQYGKFTKSFQLPDHVKEDGIEASYDDGILGVVIPKDEVKRKASVITVK